VKINLKVNGVEHDVDCGAPTLLVHLLREDLQLTATRVGCDTTSCGACTVILDGKAVKSCTVLAVQAEGKEVETLEGLSTDGQLGVMPAAFARAHALQCGFCTAGFVMAATAHLRSNPSPSEHEVRKALSGNLCRCTGYQHIVDAVIAAAAETGDR
jgi:carbon-monoxide dehydrogenase small subunit